MRIGHGYDVHKLAEGRKLILGGVHIYHNKGLLGHSDADVLTHAIMDSLLGSLALGDIGQLFPDTDPRYKGADSISLLRQVVKLIEQKGFRIVNIDATICAQKPKLAPHIKHMRFNIARACGIDMSQGTDFTSKKVSNMMRRPCWMIWPRECRSVVSMTEAGNRPLPFLPSLSP